MRIEYDTIVSRVVECEPELWKHVQLALTNWSGETFFRPDWGFPSGLVGYLQTSLGVPIDGAPDPDYDWLLREIPADILQGITLRDYQLRALRHMGYYRRGIVAQCTGAGKSELYAAWLKLMGGPSICIFETVGSAAQMADRLEERGIDNVGMIGGGRKSTDAEHTMIVAASAYRKLNAHNGAFMRMLCQAKTLCFDEAHHLGGSGNLEQRLSWLKVANYCPAVYRFGLSATPFDQDFDAPQLRLIGALGQVIERLPSKVLRDRGMLAEPVCFLVSVAGADVTVMSSNWAHIEPVAIVNHALRNNMIASICYHVLQHEPEAKILLLVRVKNHGRELCNRLNKLGIKARFSYGQQGMFDEEGRDLKLSYATVKEQFQAGEFSVLLGSVVYDESQDIPAVTDVILGGGGKKPRRLKQRLGRGERKSKGKDYVRIWDFYDAQHKLTAKHSLERIAAFAEEDIRVINNPKVMANIICGRVHPNKVIEWLVEGDGNAVEDDTPLEIGKVFNPWGVRNNRNVVVS